jgi:hypothetical protein
MTMRHLHISRLLAALACALLPHSMSATAQTTPPPAAPALTAQTLIDRAEIEDMLTRYVMELGHTSTDAYVKYYAEDAELVLGAKSYKGHAGIVAAYAAARATPGNTRGAAYAFNTMLSNPMIVVRGDTATAQFIFTEVLTDKPGTPPHLLVQGREYDNLVRVGGRWLFSKRQIVGNTIAPVGWQP